MPLSILLIKPFHFFADTITELFNNNLFTILNIVGLSYVCTT